MASLSWKPIQGEKLLSLFWLFLFSRANESFQNMHGPRMSQLCRQIEFLYPCSGSFLSGIPLLHSATTFSRSSFHYPENQYHFLVFFPPSPHYRNLEVKRWENEELTSKSLMVLFPLPDLSYPECAQWNLSIRSCFLYERQPLAP